MFTNSAIKEVAKIALEIGTGARGLRSVIEEVLEGVIFEAEPGFRYVITEKTVRGREAVGKRVEQMRALLKAHL